MDTVVVIMQKDRKSGFLEKELASLNIENNENLIVNIFAMEEENADMLLHMKVSTDRDVLDWEYSAIFDYYDKDIYGEKVKNIVEIDDDYNPTWEIIMDYDSDILSLEDKVTKILEIHKNELEDVYNTIKDKESEYTDEEEN